MIEYKNTNLFITDSYQSISPDIENDSLLFLDFEFNNFKAQRPISIGICSIDLSKQFYAEFKYPDNYKEENEWVFNNVVAHLENKQESIIQIRKNIIAFLKFYKKRNVYLLSDSEVDVEIFKKLDTNLSNPVKITTIEQYVRAYIEVVAPPNQDIKKFMEANQRLLSPLDRYEEFFKEHNIPQHHALNDAKALATIMHKSFQKYKDKQNE